MRLRILVCLLFFTVFTEASANDLYAEINRARAGDGSCAVTDKLPPLLPRATLARAAADLARGGNLQNSLEHAGYRPTHSSALTISGEAIVAAA